MRVHIQHRPDDEALKVLQKALDNDIELTWGDRPPESADYAVLVSGRPARELIEASQSMSTLLIPWAGLPVATAELLRDFPDIVVHNLHHNAPATAEIAVALMLAAAKSLVSIDGRFRNGDWSDRGRMDRALELNGRTALVLGYGAIGRRVARACRALDMTVHAIARNQLKGEHGVEVHLPEKLDELLPAARAVIVCLPATDETRGMFNAARIGKLGRDAVVVNVARGGIIDEEALFAALKDRRIFAAGLDVWWDYPESREKWTATLPSRLPFHELDNVVISPHRGGHVRETETRRMEAVAEVLNAAARGEEIPNRMDLKAGY